MRFLSDQRRVPKRPKRVSKMVKKGTSDCVGGVRLLLGKYARVSCLSPLPPFSSSSICRDLDRDTSIFCALTSSGVSRCNKSLFARCKNGRPSPPPYARYLLCLKTPPKYEPPPLRPKTTTGPSPSFSSLFSPEEYYCLPINIYLPSSSSAAAIKRCALAPCDKKRGTKHTLGRYISKNTADQKWDKNAMD